jgi:hypothetical protein
MTDPGSPSRETIALTTILAVVLVAGFVVLAIAGVDTTAYVLFCAGPAVSTAVGFVLSHKVAKVAQVVSQVERQTNGMATARVDSLNDHLTAQDLTAAQVATAAAKRAQRPTQDPMSSPTVVPTDGP